MPTNNTTLTMNMGYLFLAVTTWVVNCAAHPILIQPSSLSASLGETVRLSCMLNLNYCIGNRYLSWYQQKPGNAPRLVYYYHFHKNDHGRGPGIPDRFKGCVDICSNTAYLTITDVQVEDDANYYCGMWIDDLSNEVPD